TSRNIKALVFFSRVPFSLGPLTNTDFSCLSGSNVQGIQTTATFDRSTDEFIINTPNEGTTKWWIGNATCHGKFATVFARLRLPSRTSKVMEDLGVWRTTAFFHELRSGTACVKLIHATAATAVTAVTTAPSATAATTVPTAMASPTVLTFDAEGRAVDFDVWWTTRDVVARLAVCSHLPPAERTHFGQYKTAQSLYDAVVARYSSPATAAFSRLMLPYLFHDLAAFAKVADLVAHLCTSDARYSAALPTEFCAKNPPPHVHHTLLPSHPPP
ncbi:unnamed protein product, partial [Closterium sp. NIES-53]